MQRGTRLEVSTAAFDESNQIVGTDPYGSPSYTGIRIPGTPPSSDPNLRYLFLLAYMRFGVSQKARIVGLRQLLTIASPVAIGEEGDESVYPLELPVTSPIWHFTDANVSWHLMRVPPNNWNNFHPDNSESLQFLMGETPALLFQNPPSDVGGYIPPNRGIPWGTALTSDLGTFHDMRFPWHGNAWHSLDIEFQGAGGVALFASVRQTIPSGVLGQRIALELPAALTPPNDTLMQKEDAFVYNFPNSIYWRVGGSLIVEFPNEIPEPRDYMEGGPVIFGKAPKEK